MLAEASVYLWVIVTGAQIEEILSLAYLTRPDNVPRRPIPRRQKTRIAAVIRADLAYIDRLMAVKHPVRKP